MTKSRLIIFPICWIFIIFISCTENKAYNHVLSSADSSTPDPHVTQVPEFSGTENNKISVGRMPCLQPWLCYGWWSVLRYWSS